MASIIVQSIEMGRALGALDFVWRSHSPSGAAT